MSSLYKRNGVWYIQFQKDGKTVQRSCRTRQKTLAMAVQKKVDESLRNVPPPSTDTTMAELFGKTEHYAHYTPYSKRGFIVAATRWDATGIPVNRATKNDVIAFVSAMKQDKLNPSTIHDYIIKLGTIFNRATKHGVIEADTNPFKVDLPRVQPHPPRWLTEREAEILIANAERKGPVHYRMIMLGLYAGMRYCEMSECHRSWFCLDTDRPTITIKGKGGKVRVIPCHPRLVEMVQPLSGYIVPVNRKLKNERIGHWNSIRLLAESIGIKGVTNHVLRHTFASRLAQAGVSLYKIQKWLGHASFATTQVYAHLCPDDREIELI